MTTRNFNALFEPSAIALIGASNRPGSVGEVLARNLLESGFSGAVLPVNPHERAVRSALAYPSVADLPVTPDLAVIATPAATVPDIVAQLGARGCRAAVVISAGIALTAAVETLSLPWIVLNASSIPRTVPRNPMSGSTKPTDPIAPTPRSSLGSSSSAASTRAASS